MDEAGSGARHVVLVGMMGAGKSTVGRRLAARLGRSFVDLDIELEQRSGRSVRAWFAESGEAAFRSAETGLLGDVLAAREPVVAAAGGGVVCRAENRARLSEPDVAVVWLDAPASFLASRLAAQGAGGDRPLLDADPRSALERLHAERGAWYAEVADVTVAVDREAQVVDVVLAELERHGAVSSGTAP